MQEISKTIIKKDDQYLILLRAKKCKHFPNVWDFPGGKVEAGESFLQAAFREAKEESNLNVEISQEIKHSRFQNENYDLSFHYFEAKSYTGDVKISEDHDDFKWASKEELEKLELSPSISSFFDLI